MAKVLCIPHLGASTEESEDNCAVMAVKQIVDFIENGNVVNSVNFPNLNGGVPQSEGRMLVLYKNHPDLTTVVTDLFAALKTDNNIKLEGLQNKVKGAYGVMLIDMNVPGRFSIQQRLAQLEGVLTARIVK
jgi:D-3-phosphoglycerate dehydrogenase